MLSKRPPVATIVPSGMNIVIGALVYRGIPLDLWFRPRQSHHLPGDMLPNGYKQPIEFPIRVPAFNSTEKELIFIIYDYISDDGKKGVIFDEIYPFA